MVGDTPTSLRFTAATNTGCMPPSALVRTGAVGDVRLDADVLGAKLKLAGDLIYGPLATYVLLTRAPYGPIRRSQSAA